MKVSFLTTTHEEIHSLQSLIRLHKHLEKRNHQPHATGYSGQVLRTLSMVVGWYNIWCHLQASELASAPRRGGALSVAVQLLRYRLFLITWTSLMLSDSLEATIRGGCYFEALLLFVVRLYIRGWEVGDFSHHEIGVALVLTFWRRCRSFINILEVFRSVITSHEN